jgi:Lon protease-like protein
LRWQHAIAGAQIDIMSSWGMTSIPLLPLFPLNTVFYPDGHLPLQIFEVRYLDMIRKCIASDTPFGVVGLLQGSEVRKPGQQEHFAEVGTMAYIENWLSPQPALMQLSCRGGQRFRILSRARQTNGLWLAEVELIDPDTVLAIPSELQDVADALGTLIRSLQERAIAPDQMPISAPFRLDECDWVANRWCELLDLRQDQRQRLLEQPSPLVRLELVQDLLNEQDWLG